MHRCAVGPSLGAFVGQIHVCIYDKQLERVLYVKFKIHLAREAHQCVDTRGVESLSRASLHIYAELATRQTELPRLPACLPAYLPTFLPAILLLRCRYDIWMRTDVDSILS